MFRSVGFRGLGVQGFGCLGVEGLLGCRVLGLRTIPKSNPSGV